MCFHFNSVFWTICLSGIFNLLKKPEIKKENSIKKKWDRDPKRSVAFFRRRIIIFHDFFPEYHPIYIIFETTTWGRKPAHIPNKEKTDSKGIKMTPLAGPNQVL